MKEVDKAINQTIDDWKSNPLNFNKENSIQTYLSNKIKDNLEKEEAEVKEVIVEKYTTEKKDFFEDEMEKRGKTVNRVIQEAAVIRNGDDDGKSIDIGVLKEEAKIQLKNGSQKYYEEDFEVLIELKYPPNNHFYKVFDKKKNKGEDFPNGENSAINPNKLNEIVSQDQWKDDYGIEEDIKELSKVNCRKIVLVFSHYDLLFQKPQRKNRAKEIGGNEEIYNKIGDYIYQFFNNMATEKDVEFKYCSINTAENLKN